MKTVGSLIAGIGLVVAIALSVIPTHVSFFGASGSCGVPVLGVLQTGYGQDSFDTTVRQQCKSQSKERLFAAVAVGLGSTVIGGLIGGIGLIEGAVGGASRRNERRWDEQPPQVVYVTGPPPATVETPAAYAEPAPAPAPAPEPQPGQQLWQRLGLPVWIGIGVLVFVAIASTAFLVGRAGRYDAPSAGAQTGASPSLSDAPSSTPADVEESDSPAAPARTGVGYGDIKIGMTVDELSRSELVSPDTDWETIMDPADGGCAMVPLTHRDGFAMLQPDTQDVAAIQFGDGMKTSRGIGLGSTTEDLATAYPEHDWYANGMDGGDQVRVNDETGYYIGVGSTGHVEQLILASDTQACFG